METIKNIRKRFISLGLTIKDLEDTKKAREEQKAAIERKIIILNKKISDAQSMLDTGTILFKKEIGATGTLSYRYCTNRIEISSDPHARASDYDFEEGRVTLTVKKVTVLFAKHEKSFYSKGNVSIILSVGYPFHRIVLNIDGTVQSCGDADYDRLQGDFHHTLESDDELSLFLIKLRKQLK